MGFLANRRIVGWTYDFAQWAQLAWKQHEHDDKSDYYLGVIASISAAQAHKNLIDQGWSLGMHSGANDAAELIAKVLRFGDAPAGDFGDLLEAPYMSPLSK